MPGILLTGDTAIGAEAWEPVLEAITAQISVTTVMGAIASVVGAGIALVFAWWGVRKLKSVIMNAALKGKLKF